MLLEELLSVMDGSEAIRIIDKSGEVYAGLVMDGIAIPAKYRLSKVIKLSICDGKYNIGI